MDFYTEIIDLLREHHIQNKEQLHKKKIQLCKKYKKQTIPSNSEILAHLPPTIDPDHPLFSILQKKPMRTISGVAIIAVMTSPAECPHGRCTPCPGGPKKATPQSYTGQEPAALRATLHAYDPYKQTKNRLEQLENIGHPTDKIDLIIMGGTFTARQPYYQEWFIKRCFDALNTKTTTTLEEAHQTNETASHRCIGLTIETRPDWFVLHHADHALYLGATRVELGVQTLYDDILYQINRGHTVTDTIYATQIAKNSGFKICYHLMPGLPGTTKQKDITMFKTIFNDARFQPDMIKIYPTLVTEDSTLYTSWKQRTYTPLTTSEAITLIATIKPYIPEWVRIQRIQRDVPANLIKAGVTKSNLRQWITQTMNEHGTSCRCIRCREIGHKTLKNAINLHELSPTIITKEYEGSGSTDIFISIEDKNNDVLLGYLRLRDIINTHRPELTKNKCMIIRELKILGKEVPLGTHQINALQHQGYGKILLEEAEKICQEEFDKTYLMILSGIGVKPYYHQQGFTNQGIYLGKKIS